MHPDVVLALNRLRSSGAVLATPRSEEQNAEYGAVVVSVDGLLVRLRVGKQTPTKTGHFVTVWRRDDDGVSVPFRDDDGIGELQVAVRGDDQAGVYCFPTAVLLRRGIVSGAGSSGKRGFRVYAPWVPTTNAQARRSKEWQVEHFQHF